MCDMYDRPEQADIPLREDRPLRKGVYLLPNLFTTTSLLFGFLGMVWSTNGLYEYAAMAILVSAILDGLDGTVARLTNSTSAFGMQYDSLADIIAFGVNPALLLYFWKLDSFGRLGLMAAFLFVCCGALRLARFNVMSASGEAKKHFVGLPIPIAACLPATLVLFSPFLPGIWLPRVMSWACLVLAYVLSFLMVSHIRYVSFKEYGIIKAHPFSTMVMVILIFVLVASQPRLLSFVMLLVYIVSGPVYTYLILPRRRLLLLRELS
ncbi:CDP-diacylglycerol--serine O-phosphatidyltransferase [Desulfovibrionales bacterium]